MAIAVATVAGMYIGHYSFRNMAFGDIDFVFGIYLLAIVSILAPYGLLHRLNLRGWRGLLRHMRMGASADAGLHAP
jgi:high-affinity Fe2+/Pb2+ permease